MTEELKPDRRGAPKTGSRVGTPFEGHRGNLPHERTPEKAAQVERMAGLQISQAEIAMVMGVGVDTIQKHYREEFDRGRSMQGIKLREHAYRMAYGIMVDPDKPELGYKPGLGPSEKMTTFMLERQHGLVPQTRMEHVGDPEQPVEIRHVRRVVVDPKAIDGGE